MKNKGEKKARKQVSNKQNKTAFEFTLLQFSITPVKNK